jgi:hypothetical protein
MDPNQQYQPPTGNSYDFILNPQKAPKAKKIGFGGNSNFGFTIAIIVGGAVFFMVILALILNAFGGSGGRTTDFISLTQTQTELIRISDQGAKSAVQQSTKNLSVTIQYSVSTQRQQTLNYLGRNGTTVGEKDLKLKQNATTDQQLASAKATSTFDLVFAEIMQDQLTTYANSLKQVHGLTTNQFEKELLSTYHEQTQLLISQIPYTQDSINAANEL